MIDLSLIWVVIIAVGVLIYVILDGFDLGIGILFPFFPHKDDRDVMMNTVAPVWDGNETWMVLGGAGLFAAFPLVYSTVLSALYMPIILMVIALIFRGVAFEFRFKANRSKHWWDKAFIGGSALTSFLQGVILGAYIQGIETRNGIYAGGGLDWLTPFSLFTGLSVMVLYAALGCGWLHVQTRHGQRLTGRRGQDVVGRQHEDAGLGLRLGAQRQVHSHLVTVEVSVERRADEGVQLDGLTLDELRLERLDAQTVQGRCAVEQHGVFGDDLFEDVPHLRMLALHHALGRLDVLSVVEIDQALHHEGLEQLESHGLRQTALVQVQLRTDDDDRTARVVHTLAEQVLTEASLLALEHVRQRLERAVARSGHRTSATSVVEQRVHGLLQHPLLVVDDDLGSTEVEQTLEAGVAVDDATVEVIEVRGREASTIELHHRAQLRRDHRDNVEDHALGVVVGGQERVDDLEALERTGLALTLAGGDELTQLLGFAFEVEVDEALLDGFGAHGTGEVQAEAVEHLAVQALVTFEVVDLEQ